MNKLYSYNEIEKGVLNRFVEIEMEYHSKTYWITIGREYFFGDVDGTLTLRFSSRQELLDSPLVDGKTLSELWEDIEAVYMDG